MSITKAFCAYIILVKRILDFDDFEKLPMTKWNNQQSNADRNRKNPMLTGGNFNYRVGELP